MTTIDTPTQSPRRHPFVRFLIAQGFYSPGGIFTGLLAIAFLGAGVVSVVKPLITPDSTAAVSAEIDSEETAKTKIDDTIKSIQDTRQVKLSPLQRAKVNEAREELRQQVRKLDSVLAEPAK